MRYFDQGAYRQTYNKLRDIEEMDAILCKLGKERHLGSLSDIIIRHRVERVFGIRLLHSHNSVDAEELMVEMEEADTDGRACLTTTVHRAPELNAEVFPNTWVVRSSTLHPIEFSADPRVDIGAYAAVALEAFASEYGQYLHENGIEDVLGLCVVRRSYYDRYLTGEHLMPVETIDEKRRANIVRVEDIRNFEVDRIIEATWAARRRDDVDVVNGCSSYCHKGACDPHTVCVKSGTSHSSQTNHSSQHAKTHSPH